MKIIAFHCILAWLMQFNGVNVTQHDESVISFVAKHPGSCNKGPPQIRPPFGCFP